MANVYEQIAYAIGLAVLYGVSHYFDKLDPTHFDPKIFLKTVLIGVAVGCGQFALGMTYEQGLQWVSTNMILMYLIDSAVNKVLGLKPKAKPEPSTNVGGVPLR